MTRGSRLRIVVSGMLAGVPGHGGATWAVLQYVLGLRRLGHDVCFIEPVKAGSQPLDQTAPAAYFEAVTVEFGLQGSAALMAQSGDCVGMEHQNVAAFCDDADLLLNISGMLTDDGLLGRIPVRVFLDLDPAFTQLWQAAQGIDMGFGRHTHLVTIGTRLGSEQCDIPLCGREWLTTLQPIVLEHWPRARVTTRDAYTTVANWRAYGSIEHAGVFYGQKAHSLRRFIGLPLRTPQPFHLALAIHPDEVEDIGALRANGWHVEDPAVVASTPDDYFAFIQGSRAEFGIAKSGYVASRCGWFSDRSICYLASGRPVIAQQTGFTDDLTAGGGLFAFESKDEVLSAIDAIESNYDSHSNAAREIAEVYFDSDSVLPQLLDGIFAGSPQGGKRG